MKEEHKTKEQLINELAELRQRIAELEASEIEQGWVEEALRRERDFAESLIETARAIVLVLDTEGRIVRFNPYMEEISGYRLKQMKGKDWFATFLPERDWERIRALFFKAVDSIQTRGNVNPIVTRDGCEREIEWWDTTLKDADGRITGLLSIGQDITERVRVEEALHLFKAIVEASNEAIAINDPEGQVVYINPAHEKLFGRPLEEARRINYRDYYPPESVEIINRDVAPALARGKSWEGELDVFDANGRRFPLWERADSLRDTEGNMLYGFGLMHDVTERKRAEEELSQYRDHLEDLIKERTAELAAANEQLQQEITERKRAEEALRRRNRELTLLNRAGQAFTATLDPDQVLVTVLEEVRRLLDVVACSVWLTDPETDELVCRQAVGPQSEIVRGWRLAPGEGLAGWVACSGESLIASDTQADERHFKGVDEQTGLALRSILSVPLRIKEHVIGVLQVVDTEVGRFSPTDLTLLEPLAASAASAIENARLFERERDQRELSEALEKAAAAVSSTLDLDQVLDRILEQVERVVAGEAFSVILIEEDAARLARWRGYELPEEKMQPSRFEIPITKYPNLMKMARTGGPVVVPDTLADPDWVPAARDRGWRRSYVGAPIQVEDVVVGFLNVSGTRPGQSRPEDARWLETFASHAAIAIGNALLYEQALEDAETKATLLREVNHRVKNNLAAIIGLLYAERRRAGIKDQAVYQSTIQNLANRVQSLTRVHSLLSASEWAPLPLSELTTQVISSSLRMLPPGKRISVDVTPSPVRVTSDQAHNLALVINELTTNTAKHALQKRNTAQITVRIALDDDTVLFEYRDDGPGYPEEVLQLERHNVGFDLMQKMVGESLRGELSLHNDHGAMVIIRFQAKA